MKTLYHYTSVDTLLLILQNKTLRFKSLLYVDDPLEPTTSDFGNLGGFKYVSCWTDTPNSIPQWTMYSNNMTGVCIGISFEKETCNRLLTSSPSTPALTSVVMAMAPDVDTAVVLNPLNDSVPGMK